MISARVASLTAPAKLTVTIMKTPGMPGVFIYSFRNSSHFCRGLVFEEELSILEIDMHYATMFGQFPE